MKKKFLSIIVLMLPIMLVAAACGSALTIGPAPAAPADLTAAGAGGAQEPAGAQSGATPGAQIDAAPGAPSGAAPGAQLGTSPGALPGGAQPGATPGAQPDESAVIRGVPIHPALRVPMAQFPSYTTNTNPILPRGTGANNVFRFAIASNSPLIELFLPTHATDAFAGAIGTLGGSNMALVSATAGFMLSNNGIATFHYDRASNVVVLEMQADVFWHDGVPLTLDDLVFAYEVIAHPDYTGLRFDAVSQIPNVVGVEEFRNGERSYISGLVLSNNNRTLHIHYVDPLPPAALYAGGIWLVAIPRHWITPVIEEVGHEGIENHVRAREETLGFGPFIIDTVVPGESVFLVPNDNYWQGAPLVDGVSAQIIHTDLVSAAMRAGEFDAVAYSTYNLAEFNLNRPTNYQLYAWPSNATTFLNFRLGGIENGEVFLRDDNHPITNVAIRRALAHAVDREAVAYSVGQGLWVPATSVLHPFNATAFIDPTLEGFSFDLDLANQILDEAGFTARDAEGYRLDLEGNHMYFVYAQHDNPTHRVLVPLNIQNWSEIGLRVELFEGGFVDWRLFSETVLAPEVGDIHIFAMGWNLNWNPAPHSLWSPTTEFNMPRYTSPTFRRILDDISSDTARWDPDFLAEAYSRWEAAFFDEVPAIPFTWNIDLVALNNRVANVSRIRQDTGISTPANWTTTTFGSHLVALTSSSPHVDRR
ncbi:MAG: ABC transporter substrate-binding protein [Oscillospiraceae bacterium]|nr:ABC transporter substrate-binding protein [Oscillospiraceae bacterium]